MTNARPCPLCLTAATVTRADERDAYRIDCPECTLFYMTDPAFLLVERMRQRGDRLAFTALSDLAARTTADGGSLTVSADAVEDVSRG